METLAEIIVGIRSENLDRSFTYRVPQGMEIQVGSRVVVPFGRQRLEGYCIAVIGGAEDKGQADFEYKEIEALLDDEPVLTEELIELSAWGAARWLCSRTDLLKAMVPAGLRFTTSKWVTLLENAESDTQELLWLRENGPVTLAAWQKLFPSTVRVDKLRRLQQKGIIKLNNRESRGIGQEKVQSAHLLSAGQVGLPTGKKQALALDLLRKHGSMALAALADAGVSRATIHSMAKKGWIAICEQLVRRDPLAGETFLATSSIELTAAQAEAIRQVESACHGTGREVVLLHGVTGSGKTEVYLQAIGKVVAAGMGSILLVPEIALTPQMIERFVARFGRLVAVLHSRLSAGERHDEWWRIVTGEALVVVGARSAVFAPFKQLGLIVLDEEHEASYKQDETPRYHARDVAMWRAKKHGVALVLGSATPSLESYNAALSGKYALCLLPERVENRPLPPVDVVDMRQELKEGHRSIFSRALLNALEKVQQEKKQAILLLNRRGYATFVLCRGCGFVMRCKMCNVSLKFHLAEEVLRCHYCDYGEPYPSQCPVCASRYIRHFGTGTQKVAEELQKNFPTLRVARVDADSTAQKGAYQKIFGAFKSGSVDVLIGTQMVAKGLDFPNVTLVGVVTADTTINLPDFRAGERTFQLLTQIAGRAGRGNFGGRVLVQTYTPDHYAIQAARTHDFETFFAQESKARKELGYPPYAVFIRLLLTGSEEDKVVEAASLLASLLEATEILGPSPCPLERIRGQFRWQVVARGQALEPLLLKVREAAEIFRKSLFSGSVRLVLDVEPQSLL
ncbi:MAG: Primosomal protein N' [Syntrophomonadaceae bacterium]|nr:Primosomal protein N' [Bacillota bacterium]